jgi:hypothetical protein
LTIYQEDSLVGYDPKTPVRDQSKDRKSKQQLSDEIFDAALTHFRSLFKSRYKIKAPKIKKIPKFRQDFTTQFNTLMSQTYREKQVKWGSMPNFSSREVHMEMLRERLEVAVGFVDWLFTPGNRFGEVCQGDFISSHWWIEYTKSLLQKRDRQKGFTETVAEVESTEKDRWRESSW